jgi:hypothetical protein
MTQRLPPSTRFSRLFTLIAPIAWPALPLALWFRRKERKEVAADPDVYRLPSTMLDRPLAFFAGAMATFFVAVVGGYCVLGWLGVSPV